MNRSYLEKVYFKKRTTDSLRKLKNKIITLVIALVGFTKTSGENISKVLIQIGLVRKQVLGQICNLFSLKNEKLAIR